jgi:hypothetical protein
MAVIHGHTGIGNASLISRAVNVGRMLSNENASDTDGCVY